MRTLAVLVCLGFATDVIPQTDQPGRLLRGKPPSASYLRLHKDEDGDLVAMQTAVTRFVPESGSRGLEIDLVAAVHIGDRYYYDKLNKLFRQYDVVLYELVAPPGTRIPKGGRRELDNPLAIIQKLAKVILDLELQTERIDYTAKNFIHADLSFEQMAEAMRKRGDDGLTLALGVAADLLRQQNLQELNRSKNQGKQEEDIDLAEIFDPAGASKLKRVMARQMASLDSLEGGLGKTLSTILVTDRNKAALQVLQKEIVKGKKKIAIFYGAAHMPDFEKRLKEEFGLKRASERWLSAWDLRDKERDPLLELLKLLDR